MPAYKQTKNAESRALFTAPVFTYTVSDLQSDCMHANIYCLYLHVLLLCESSSRATTRSQQAAHFTLRRGQSYLWCTSRARAGNVPLPQSRGHAITRASHWLASWWIRSCGTFFTRDLKQVQALEQWGVVREGGGGGYMGSVLGVRRNYRNQPRFLLWLVLYVVGAPPYKILSDVCPGSFLS